MGILPHAVTGDCKGSAPKGKQMMLPRLTCEILLVFAMLQMFTLLTAQQQSQVHLLKNFSNQNYASFTVERLNETKLITENTSISSQANGMFEGSLPKQRKAPDSFLFKFSVGFIFAVTPVSETCMLQS